MNMKDWYDAVKHNGKLAEKREVFSRNYTIRFNIDVDYEFSLIYNVFSNTDVGDLIHQIVSDIAYDRAHNYHVSYTIVYDETVREWIVDEIEKRLEDAIEDYEDAIEDYYFYYDDRYRLRGETYMNTQDWYDAMEHNRKLAEKRGEFSHSYTISSNTNVNDLAHQIASDMAHDYHESYASVYDEAYDTAQEWIENYHNQYDYDDDDYYDDDDDDYDDDDYDDDDYDDDDYDDDDYDEDDYDEDTDKQEDIVSNALYDLELALDEAIHSSNSSITSENNSIVINTGKRIFHLVTDAVTPQTIEKIVQKMKRIFNSEDRMNVELLIADLKTALNMVDIKKFELITYDNDNFYNDYYIVSNALYDLELALDEAIHSSNSSITSENNSIVINTGKRIFHLVTDAVTPQTIEKIVQKMNRIFNSEDRMNVELFITDLKTALNTVDIKKFKLITYDNHL